MKNTHASTTSGFKTLFRIVEPMAVVFAALIAAASAITEKTLISTGLSQPTDVSLKFETVLWLIGSYILIRLAFLAWDDATSKECRHKGLLPIDSPYARIVVYALAIFVIWMLIWIIPHYPGTLRDDTVNELFQSTGTVGWYNQHPVFDTMVFGLFWSIGDAFGKTSYGLFIFVLVNALLLAVSIAASLAYGEEKGAPKWLVLVIIVIVSLGRAFYQPADAMSKDSISAWMFVLSALAFVHIVATRGKALDNRRFLVAAVSITFLCMISKRIMIAVFMASYLILLLVLLASRRESGLGTKPRRVSAVAAMALLPVIGTLLIWNPVTGTALDVYQTKSNEIYSIPVQQLFYAASKDPSAISEKERDTVSTYIDFPAALEEYNPTRSDEVFRHVAEYQRLPLGTLKTWISVGLRNPALYAESLVVQAGRWTSLRATIDYGHNSAEELLCEGRMESWTREGFKGDRAAADLFFSRYNWNHPESLSEWTASAEENDKWQQESMPAIASYGLYCFAIPMTLLAWCLSRKKGRAFLSAMPTYLVMATLLIGPMVLYWYTVPMVFVSPLLLMLPFAFTDEEQRLVVAKRANAALELKPRELVKDVDLR